MAKLYVDRAVGVILNCLHELYQAIAEGQDRKAVKRTEGELIAAFTRELDRSFRNGKRWAWEHPEAKPTRDEKRAT
jgi:hypothetical protein